ncbi:uncharacterized protein LOC123270811 [Cotesia glomerata]|uniref:uncharacterized protein LOC123270811 n=1 Tax=Cotesia glomerata TaxID=32391 RepID=UPI001D01B106|nr:uncharacterized protein LOC123270811 [Cotesia glomerata]
MNFQGLFVLIILQLYRDTVVSAFDRDTIEAYLRQRETVGKAEKEVDPGIQILLQNFRTKIITDVKEELQTVSKDAKSYQKRSLIATSEYLTKVVADEIKPIKELLISLNGMKNIFHEELTAKVRSSIKDELSAFQRMEMESLVLRVKNEIIESFQAEFVDVKTSLQLEGASVRDLVVNQTKVQSEGSLINQQADARIRQLEKKCEIKRLIETAVQVAGDNSQAVDQKLKNLDEGIQNLTLAHHSLPQAMSRSFKNDDGNELVERLEKKIEELKPNASCELTPVLALIKSTVETIKNDRDARSEILITKLVDKIEHLLTAKLKSRTTSCELSRHTKSTLAAIKAATDTLLKTAATSYEENKLEEKFKALLTKFNGNTTVGFDEVNSKLNAITETASSWRQIESILATEMDKFLGKQLTSIKTAIGDVLPNVPKNEKPELGGEDGVKSAEMIKLEDIEILVKEAKEKVKIELGEVESRILKAFNETIFDRLVVDGKGCIEPRVLTGGDDTGRLGGDTEHTGGDDTEHSGGDDTEHTGGDGKEHTGGDDMEHSGGDDTEHTGGDDAEHSGGDDTEHSGGNVTEHSEGNVTEHSEGDDTEHSGEHDTEHTEGDDAEHSGGDDTEHSGGDDTEHTEGDDAEHSGENDTEHTEGGDAEHSGGDDTEHTGGDDTEHSGEDSEEH